MTATRLAFSSALVLILSAFVCNAQVAPPDMKFPMVNIRNGYGVSKCVLSEPLTQPEIEQLGNQMLQCEYLEYLPSSQFELPCFTYEPTCESVQRNCNSMNGEIVTSDSCTEIIGQRN